MGYKNTKTSLKINSVKLKVLNNILKMNFKKINEMLENFERILLSHRIESCNAMNKIFDP